MDIVGVALWGPSSEAHDLRKGSVDRVLLTGFQSTVLEALTACWAVYSGSTSVGQRYSCTKCTASRAFARSSSLDLPIIEKHVERLHRLEGWLWLGGYGGNIASLL